MYDKLYIINYDITLAEPYVDEDGVMKSKSFIQNCNEGFRKIQPLKEFVARMGKNPSVSNMSAYIATGLKERDLNTLLYL